MSQGFWHGAENPDCGFTVMSWNYWYCAKNPDILDSSVMSWEFWHRANNIAVDLKL